MNSLRGLPFFQHLCLGNESFLAPKKRFRGVSRRGQEGCLRSMGMFDDFFKRKFRGGDRLQERILVSGRSGERNGWRMLRELFFRASRVAWSIGEPRIGVYRNERRVYAELAALSLTIYLPRHLFKRLLQQLIEFQKTL